MAEQQDLSKADLEQVRKILFGRQLQENQKQVVAAERGVKREIQSLRSEIMKRIDALEAAMRKQGAGAGKALEEEAAEREAGEAEFVQSLGELKKATQEQLARINETHTRVTRELRQRITTDVKSTREDLGARISELSEEVDVELADVRETAVAKEDLSGFLGDIALRLVNKKQIRRS